MLELMLSENDSPEPINFTPYDWSAVAMTGNTIYHNAGFGYNEQFYTVGGVQSVNGLNRFIRVGEDGSQTSLQNLPQGRYGCTATVVGSRVFVIGGSLSLTSGPHVGTVNIYNFTNNTWSTGTPVPVTICWHSAVARGNDIYIMGGWESFSASAATRLLFYRYNTINDTWTELTSPAISPRSALGLARSGSLLYVLAGTHQGVYLNDFYSYNVITSELIRLADNPDVVAPGGGLFAPDPTQLILLTGRLASQGGYTKTNRYDVKTNTWSTLREYSALRGYGGMGYANKKFFIQGGFKAGTQFNNLLMFS